MNKKIFSVTSFSLIAVFLFAMAVSTSAQHRDDRQRDKEKKKEVVRHDDYRDVSVRDRHYFYREGYYYDKRPSGYVKVPAPIGARISVLPHGYRVVRIHKVKYYVFGGIYYKFFPRENVYEVIEVPR